MDCDYKADDDAEEYDYDYIFIRKDVTINGNNHIIDGNNRTRVFMVEDGYSLTLNNLTIINARADSGAGVYLKYNASLTINNVNFINNYAHDQQGAAIYAGLCNIVNVYNSSFINNTALDYGGAIGGSNNDITIVNSTFINNTAKGEFIDYADEWNYGFGGAIHQLESSLTVINSTFRNNSARYGGAISTYYEPSDMVIINSVFIENNAICSGGAIYNYQDGSCNIVDSSFIDNAAGENGGVIYNEDEVLMDILNSSFINNTADVDGGVIFADKTAETSIVNSTFTNNAALTGFGGVIYSQIGLNNYTNVTFINNAAVSGGVFYKEFTSFENIVNSKFTNNEATNGYGGAIFIGGAINDDSVCILEHANFNKNTASDQGGAIYADDGSQLDISNSIFSSNSVIAENGLGGAIATGDECIVKITESEFTGNKAVEAGAIYVKDESIFTISNSKFDSNLANKTGAAIYGVADSKIMIDNCGFTQDRVLSDNGGIISGYSGTIEISNSDFIVDDSNSTVIYIDHGSLSLGNNTMMVVGIPIYVVESSIASPVSIVVLDNKTYDASVFDTVELNATLVDDNGNAIYDPNFRFTVNETVVDDISFDGCVYKAQYTLQNVGVNVISSNYASNDLVIKNGAYNASKIDTYIQFSSSFTRVACDYNAGERGAKFYATLKDANGNVLANKTVYISILGKTYKFTTDKDGKFGMQVNFASAGVYTYVLSFEGDETCNAADSFTTKLTVNKKAMGIKASNVAFKSYKKTKTVSVKLFTTKNPYNGKTYLTGKKVTLKVNGKTYTAQIDKYGNAKFNIKLTKKGKYTAVIKFAGDKTYKAVSKSIRVTIK